MVVSQARPGTNYLWMAPNVPRTDARMFAMIHQEAQYNLGVISGSFLIDSMDTYVLIDLGSMHSYVSFMLVQHLDRMVDWLDSSLVVAMPVGRSFIADMYIETVIS